MEAAGKDYAGIYMDTGNHVFVLEHPLSTLETLAPYILTLHLRDSVVSEHERGVAVQWVPLGEGMVDFPEIVARARELCPGVYVDIKPITGRPPEVLLYLEGEFRKSFPAIRAADLARFLTLAKSGHPYEGPVVIEDLQGRPSPVPIRDSVSAERAPGTKCLLRPLGAGSRCSLADVVRRAVGRHWGRVLQLADARLGIPENQFPLKSLATSASQCQRTVQVRALQRASTSNSTRNVSAPLPSPQPKLARQTQKAQNPGRISMHSQHYEKYFLLYALYVSRKPPNYILWSVDSLGAVRAKGFPVRRDLREAVTGWNYGEIRLSRTG